MVFPIFCCANGRCGYCNFSSCLQLYCKYCENLQQNKTAGNTTIRKSSGQEARKMGRKRVLLTYFSVFGRWLQLKCFRFLSLSAFVICSFLSVTPSRSRPFEVITIILFAHCFVMLYFEEFRQRSRVAFKWFRKWFVNKMLTRKGGELKMFKVNHI